MRNRKNALKYRKKIQWEQIAYYLDTKCPKCSQKTVWQVYEYDAKCCILCNEWLDDVCGDENCYYCNNRPQTPYEVYYFSDISPNNATQKKNWRRQNYQHKTNEKIKHNTKKKLIQYYYHNNE